MTFEVPEERTRTHAERVLDFMLKLDEQLQSSSFPAMSDFWRRETIRFYESGAKTWVARVGRGGAKSTQIVKVALAEVLAGRFSIPPGELHWFCVVAENKDEAAGRLRLIEALLKAMRVDHSRDGDSIVLKSSGWERRGFKVLAARVGAVSGFRALGLAMDEVAKWNNDGVNPAGEISASANAMLVTHPEARRLIFSSPLAMMGLHHELVVRGDTDRQIVSLAPTWVANPSVTEQRTHELEEDPRIWRREYLAEPQQAVMGAFTAEHVTRAIGREPPRDYTQCARVLILDPSAGQSDYYAFAICGWRRPGVKQKYLTERRWARLAQQWEDVVLEDDKGQPLVHPDWRGDEEGAARLVFEYVGGIDQAAKRGYSSDMIVAHVVKLARAHGATCIHSDQFERYALASAVAKHGVAFQAHAWTQGLKERAVEHVRRWLRDDVLVLPKHEKLKAEMLAFEERIAPSGGLTFRGRSGGHDDHCMLIMLAALVDIGGAGLPGSPLRGPGVPYYSPPWSVP